ncbi:DUF3618 domain-containing protein [Pseudonocardia abyssalis]|jgi:hypothetical protein|uniref:DUF3618 domain-containing protein n=1 Tax=Pseudonocardia abyssalis TaxID=2792008 RepID=A0ABS6US49_9PSEU|nr:DUF3618 domain-containing protein [Pseudonocardia abyssalis]MBW0116678.1 DUF3618 domain-containing protein [Pseudonocardia abyssalis]MBW0134683.1 DUF3618 domain-containing protein [Pseudonocardia abyssalis]
MTGAHRADDGDAETRTVADLVADGPGPVDPDRPVVDARTPEDKRAAIEELRADLGDTVSELAHRVDVPARVKARGEEVTAQAKAGLGRAQSVLDDNAPQVGQVVRERPGSVAAAALAAVLAVLVVTRLRQRNAG